MSRHYKRKHSVLKSDYVRSSFFGIEDSLVSTTGLIAGIAVATPDKQFIILAGIIAIAVEAISMAAGEFLSEETTQDLTQGKNKANPLIGGFIMLLSYFGAGLVPLLPIIILPSSYALPAAITAALFGLFALGYVRGLATNRPPLRQALRVFLIGGVATFIGIVVGILYKV
ncbi:VIT1/CCC1 transporter family protein [Candidatus Saccharibacteria bacterium]|nr:VIT1/CCC1 transporter family protein [Candidatus Saccharibacteria bacterium]